MIIDAHCHLSRRYGRGPDSLLIDSMDAAKVDKAFVFGENDFCLDAQKRHPDRLIPFFYFDPRYEEIGINELEKHVRDYGWKGVKVGHQHATARYMYNMMEKAQEHNLIVVIHSDHSTRNHPYAIGDLANSFPKVKTVILHMGAGVVIDTELVSTKIA